MKKLYEEFFQIPEDGKIRDKVMVVRVAMIVCVMITCLIAMSISAYAYFSHTVASEKNTIKAAKFEPTFTIKDASGTPVQHEQQGEHVYKLAENMTYEITIQKGEKTTASTGFCVVEVVGASGTKTYHTQQLGADQKAAEQKTESITFTLTVTEDSVLTISSNWGTSSYYNDYAEATDPNDVYIRDSESVTVTFAAPQPDDSQGNE